MIDSSDKTVTLYRFNEDPLVFDSSFFVNKLDALLKFSGADIVYATGNASEAPRGKLPVIRLNGRIVPDSENAYETCITEGIFKCLDEQAGLSEKEFGVSQALRSLMEKTIYEMVGYERWIENWYATRDEFLDSIPTWIRPPIAYWLAYRPAYAKVMNGGYGGYSDAERDKGRRDAVRALAAFIPQTGYIFGRLKPTRVDASVFGFLICIATYAHLNPKMVTEFHQYPQIDDYTRRIAREFWPHRRLLL